jgi:ATP-dependent Clp protease ATP-binding subunit ClpC
MQTASQTARRQRHQMISTLDLLAALLQVGKNSARLLRQGGVDLNRLRSEVASAGGATPGLGPAARQAKAVVDAATAEADQLQHDAIGSEHLLLGLLRSGGPAALILQRHGVSLDQVREWLKPKPGPPTPASGSGPDRPA